MRAPALILLLAAAPAGAADGASAPADADFEADVPKASIALGPVTRGRPFASVDVGWLRSGVRFDLGMGGGFDLHLRADAMLLYDRFGGQNGIHAGLRWTWTEGSLRAAVEAEAGKIFQPVDQGLQSVTTVRGDLLLGTVLDVGTIYGRVAIRGMGGEDLPGRAAFRREVEAGGGVERGWRRFVFGLEGFVLSRSGHSNLGEWRLRAGIAL